MAVRQTAQRRQEITDLILNGKLPTMNTLAERFQVSRETIRKDLLYLEKQGLGRKGYGGAFFVDAIREKTLNLRLTENMDKKAAIARAALRYIPSGSALFLDAGSTTLELARLLRPQSNLRIITNSATIPHALVDSPSSVSCLGGDLRKTSLAFTGPWTLNAIRSFHADVAFLGMDGLDESGPCTAVFAEAEVKRAMTRSAHQKILLCDSTKLERTAPVAFCGWPDIDLLITDSAIDGALAEKIQTRVPLVIAGDH